MSVVEGKSIVSPQPNEIEQGIECRVKIGKKCWPGKVAAIGKRHAVVIKVC